MPAGPMECVHGFLKEDALTRIALIRSHEQEQRVIPGINFTCNGTVTTWTIGLQIRQLMSEEELKLPEVQIWRKLDEQSNLDLIDARSIRASELTSTSYPNVYEFTPAPLSFQAGDVLGLYQPATANSEVEVYYQFDGGPVNYVRDVRVFGVQIFSGNEADKDLPLVAVNITTGKEYF